MPCSMSRKGNCWDNAPTESWFGSFKNERVYGERFATRDELQACRSNVFWKGFASPPKTVAPETSAFRPGSAPTGLKAGVSNRS